MNRTERLLDLITYLLNARDPVSWHEIKNHFPEDYARGVEESNQRKFERDKAELISLGIPIDYRSGASVKKEGYVIEKERLFLPEIEFTPQESSFLMLSASAVLENEDFPYRDQLEAALHKIASVHHPMDSPPPEIAISYHSSNRRKGGDSKGVWVRRLQDALDRRKTVEIVYHAFSSGETTRRKVNPYGLVFQRGNWTMVGWDHLRRDIRSFVVSRIQSLEVHSRRPGTPDYEIPADFRLADYQNRQQWELECHPPLQVSVLVAGHRLPELLSQLSRARRTGERTFELRVTNRTGLITWVLAHRTDVRVLDPPEVTSEIREVLAKLT